MECVLEILLVVYKIKINTPIRCFREQVAEALRQLSKIPEP